MIAEPPLWVSFGNFDLEIDPSTGAVVELSHRETKILSHGSAQFSLNLEHGNLCETRLIGTKTQRAPDREQLIFSYKLLWGEGRRCHADQTWTFSPNKIERTLVVHCPEAGVRNRLFSATLSLEGLRIDHLEQTLVSMPMTRSIPALPGEIVAGRSVDFQKNGNGFALDPSGLDVGLATAMLSRPTPPFQLTILPLPNECSVKARMFGHEGRLMLEHEFACESWIEADSPTQVAKQVFLFSDKPWQEAARDLGMAWREENYLPPPGRPQWARDAIILEVDLTFFGGLRKFTERLDEVRQMGFNTIYLMPWHSGHWNGYGTYSYDEINPAYGSFADLRSLCDAAHELGLQVLFDLLVNVAGEDSPYPIQHPEWFYRDLDGKILHHPTWRSWCLDPASPSYRKYLTEYAVRCCTEWGADGFRVDAAAYRGGSWNNLPGVQPHQHSHAIFTLLKEIREAIQTVKPHAICMAECFGPAQVPVSDLVAYQWVAWLDWVNESLLSGQLTGAVLARLLGEHFLAMPRDTWLTGYTHTHDTVAFEKRDLEGPAITAFFATLTLICAGTMVFGGGWEMRQRPRLDEREEYQSLFKAKKNLGGISCHEVTFLESDNPALLTILRPSLVGKVCVISNFSSAPQPIPGYNKAIYSRLNSGVGEIAPFDTIIVPL